MGCAHLGYFLDSVFLPFCLFSDTSILHHAFMSIFIALWAVITCYVTILMAILSYFTRFIMKRENAGSWDSGMEKEKIFETYSAQLQKF